MRSLWIVAHVSSMRIYSYYTKFLMLFNLSHTLGLLTSWESLLHWSENESEAKKLYEEMAALIGKLNQIGTTQSNLDTESAIHLAIEDAKVSSNAKLCLILDEGGRGGRVYWWGEDVHYEVVAFGQKTILIFRPSDERRNRPLFTTFHTYCLYFAWAQKRMPSHRTCASHK